MKQNRNGVGAPAEECGMAETDQTPVAAQNVPGKPEHRPDADEREHQQRISTDDKDADCRCGKLRGQYQKLATRRGQKPHQARSALRPKSPCGRSSKTAKKTTKTAVFCSCGERISVASCCTMPITSPPAKAPPKLPMPPSTTPAYIMMTKSNPV